VAARVAPRPRNPLVVPSAATPSGDKGFSAFFAVPLAVGAQPFWFEADAKPAPDSPAVKSRDSLRALLLITSDPDWVKKWDSPPENRPAFPSSSVVSNGGELSILTFLVNPAMDAERKTDVTCDLKAVRPDGSAAVDQKNLACFRTKLEGPPEHVYLSSAQLKFVAEPSDQRGLWRVFVVVRDNLRGVKLELENSFTLE
jgi:hypothetical protein